MAMAVDPVVLVPPAVFTVTYFSSAVPDQNMMLRKEHEPMINWVEKHMVQSISAQQAQETTAKCIADLQLFPRKVQAQPVM
ncbi:ATP synthase F(0) complex subunit B1, mitochondrial [Sciurus carolinensis]|uniref:ATP synthase subunit b n=1 Tax=Sciurus carolinensis TaxID=30640 RepID=A0AA41T6F0_SCICA|nr:ATP synthase F(0) complex subunit B1, mitochondrial [Sciurus carolinensis]